MITDEMWAMGCTIEDAMRELGLTEEEVFGEWTEEEEQ